MSFQNMTATIYLGTVGSKLLPPLLIGKIANGIDNFFRRFRLPPIINEFIIIIIFFFFFFLITISILIWQNMFLR